MDQLALIPEIEIDIVSSGGTAAKRYEEGKEARNYVIGEPVIPKALEELGYKINCNVYDVMRLDSLDMKPEDRDKLAEVTIDECQKNIILHQHGTDTMHLTGKRIVEYGNSRIQEEKKTIALTGSSLPYTDRNSDLPNNAKYALNKALEFNHRGIYGVFIAFNNLMISVDNARKCMDGEFIDRMKTEEIHGDNLSPERWKDEGCGVYSQR